MVQKDEPSKSDAVVFGELVRSSREARGWSLEALAAEALSNSTRKGYVSQLERGEITIKPDTAKKFALALQIPARNIPPSLRWPEAVEAAMDMDSQFRKVHDHFEEMAAKILEAVVNGQSNDQLKDAMASELGIKAELVTAFLRDLGKEPPTSTADLKSKLNELVTSYRDLASVAEASKRIPELAVRLARSLDPDAYPEPMDFNDLQAAIYTMAERGACQDAVRLATTHLRWAEAAQVNRPSHMLYTIAAADAHRLAGEYWLAKQLLKPLSNALSHDHKNPITPVALNSLALLRSAEGGNQEAKDILQHAIHISLMQVGPNDPRTKTLLSNYSNLFGMPFGSTG